MKCPNCATEHTSAFCPGCGAPGNPDQQPGKSQPSSPARPPRVKKPLVKRWWFWALLGVVLIIVVSNLGKGTQKETVAGHSALASQSNSTALTSSGTQTSAPLPTEDLSSIEKVYLLKSGHYVAGVDIPAGKCNVTAVEGNGNLSSSNLLSGGVNEMFGVDTSSDLYTKSFNGLKLPKETVLNISGGLTVQLDFTTIDSGFSGRTYDQDKAITLETGNYEAGADFTEGVYTIVALSGSGNLSSSNLINGGINEMFGVDTKTGLYLSEFTNVDLPKGTELSVVGGLTIQLIPATKK